MSKNLELLSQLEKYEGLHRSAEPRPMEHPAEDPRMSPSVVPNPRQDDTWQEEALLAHRLFVVPGEHAPRSVLFCGVENENGSDLVCARLGELLAARNGARICLVDAGLRSPSLRNRYQQESPFRSDQGALFGDDGDQFAHQIAGKNLWLWAPDRGRQESFSAGSFRTVIPGLAQQFGTILAAAGPLLGSSETMALARLMDGVVLVIRANSTRRFAAIKAKEILEASQVRLFGAILTDRVYPIPEVLYRKL